MKILSMSARVVLIAAALPGMSAWGSAAPETAHEFAQPREEEEEPRPEDVIWKKVEKFPFWSELSLTMQVNRAGAPEFPVHVDVRLTEDRKKFRTFRISSRAFSYSVVLDGCVKAGEPDLSNLYLEYYAAEQEEDFEFIIYFSTLWPKGGKSGIAGYDRYQIWLDKDGGIRECEFIPHE